MLQYCSLSSSSTYGNAYLIRSQSTVVLVDCGLSLRRLERAATAVNVDLQQVSAVLITHHHGDHTRALRLRRPLSIRYDLPVYGSDEFWSTWNLQAAHGGFGSLERQARVLIPGHTVTIGDICVSAFARPHDASGSLGYVLSAGAESVAVLTDLGHVPDQLLSRLRGTRHLIVEANHDVAMESQSARPEWLKARVMGPLGHLSNQQAGRAIAAMSTDHTRSVLLAHLSLDCNLPALALETVSRCLHARRPALHVAPPDRPSPWLGR